MPKAKPWGALLAPGAGADRDQPALVAIDDALTARGLVVERMDFPYRMAGRRAPDRPPVLLDAVADAAAGVQASGLVLGGRSMGGRMCSMAVAQGRVSNARALVLISYPLHPPGRPDKQAERTAHFPDLHVPCLFVSGTRDAFGTPEELEAATRAIAGPVAHRWVEGGDHGLRRRDQAVADLVSDWIEGIIH